MNGIFTVDYLTCCLQRMCDFRSQAVNIKQLLNVSINISNRFLHFVFDNKTFHMQVFLVVHVKKTHSLSITMMYFLLLVLATTALMTNARPLKKSTKDIYEEKIKV